MSSPPPTHIIITTNATSHLGFHGLNHHHIIVIIVSSPPPRSLTSSLLPMPPLTLACTVFTNTKHHHYLMFLSSMDKNHNINMEMCWTQNIKIEDNFNNFTTFPHSVVPFSTLFVEFDPSRLHAIQQNLLDKLKPVKGFCFWLSSNYVASPD
jgi:hypothetical protein